MRDEKYLHQFRVLAEEKSFSLACQKLHLSQSALTKNIRKIEDRLNVKLFDRHPRGVVLTEYGEILINHVRKMEKEYNFAMQQIESLKGEKGRRLWIGSGLVWADSLLPQVLSKFYKRYPGVEVVLRGGDISDQLPDLVRGSLDVVLGRTDYEFETSEKLEKQHLIDVEYVVVAGKNHPLAGKNLVQPSDLVEFSWLLYHQTRDHYKYMDNYFAEHNLPSPHFALNSKFYDTAAAMLTEKDYLMCLPKHSQERFGRDNLIQLNMEKPIWTFPSGIWMRKNALDIREMGYFMELIKEFDFHC